MQIHDILNHFPRTRLMNGPTPIQRLERLEALLGEEGNGVSIWAKRDDFMALGGGGNKLRKLEFLIGQARAEGCDTIIAMGGVQSNFARLAAAACARVGMACELVLAQMVPRTTDIYRNNGNVLLDRLLGARVHILGVGENAGEFAGQRADEIAASGSKAFIATLGGSTPVGCLGYVECAFEIATQSIELGLEFDQICIPNGSGGMHAGLAVGSAIMGRRPSRIKAYAVLSPLDAAVNNTADKVNAVLGLLSNEARIEPGDLTLDASQLGEGYGVPTQSMIEAVTSVGRAEGILLDPVYGGKAFAGMLADIKSGVIMPGSSMLFVMTGGSPGLYAYQDIF